MLKKLSSICNKIYSSKLFIVLTLVMITIVASVPAFRSAVYEGHDLPFHLGRIQTIAEGLQSGQFPVRYDAKAWNGYGYISSIMYGNIFLYFPAVLYMMGTPVFRVFNIYVILVNIATVTISYYSFKRLFKDSYYGLVATALYTLIGYRIMNVYLRTAVGEFSAMMFLPLYVYGLYRIYKGEFKENIVKQCLPFIIATSGLIQTHILTTEMVAIFTAIVVITNIKTIGEVIKPIIVSLLFIVGINLFFLVPFIDIYISMDLNISSRISDRSVQGSGLYLSQLFGLITGARGQNAL